MNEDLPRLEKVRGYNEAPAKPPRFDEAVTRIAGCNLDGQPLLRVDWGWDCRMFRKGNANALAFPGPFLNRWILRKWMSPHFFGSERQWNERRYSHVHGAKNIDLLGPFPRQGFYGMVMPLIDPEGGFIPLSDSVLRFIEKKQSEIQSQTLNVYSDAKLYARLQQQMADEEARLNAEGDKEAAEFGEYVFSHEDEINRNPVFSLPTTNSLWTPQGEHTFH